MASEVDICNLALSLLGQRAEVISLSPPDDSAEAGHCGRFYPMARDELLEMHPWTFATRRVALAAVTNDRLGWGYAYALPSTCLRPRSVLGPGASDEDRTEDFIVEGGKTLYTSTPEATLIYTELVTDATRFTPLFTAALARLLAMKLAGLLIKGSAGMQVSMQHEKLFLLERAEAVVTDSNSGSRSNALRNRIPDSIRARNGWPLGYSPRGWGGY